jgi:hypothetical protein
MPGGVRRPIWHPVAQLFYWPQSENEATQPLSLSQPLGFGQPRMEVPYPLAEANTDTSWLFQYKGSIACRCVLSHRVASLDLGESLPQILPFW